MLVPFPAAAAIVFMSGSMQKTGAEAQSAAAAAERIAANGTGVTHAVAAAEPPASPDSGSASDLQQLLVEADDAAGKPLQWLHLLPGTLMSMNRPQLHIFM